MQAIKGREIRITPYLSVKIIGAEVDACVKGKPVKPLKINLLEAPIKHEYANVDELIAQFNVTGKYLLKDLASNLETELLFHAENLIKWVEADYDTRTLHSELAWPLLIELAKYDSHAMESYKQQLQWIQNE